MSQPAGWYGGYPIYVAERRPKKYYAVVDGSRVYFGDTRYQQFYDKMGHYAALNHHDETRRANYKKRHAKDRVVRGSAGWFADQILW
jgi:hypothetical protein